MIKINDFSVEHWVHNNQWFVCFPDGSGLSVSDNYDLSVVLKDVLFWISDGIKSIFEL